MKSRNCVSQNLKVVNIFVFVLFLSTQTFAQTPTAGNALHFDGIDDKVECGDINEAETGSGTFELWFKVDEFRQGTGAYNILISKTFGTGFTRWLGFSIRVFNFESSQQE